MAGPWIPVGEEHTSRLVEPYSYDNLGFCEGFPLRRHRCESQAIGGSRKARSDWLRYLGPIDTFGNCNLYSGHFAALTLPLCRPERLRAVSYLFEFAFLYDQRVELAEQGTFSTRDERFGPSDVELRKIRDVNGSKQIQSKMMLQLLRIDPKCAQVVIDAWERMLSKTAKLHKNRMFNSFDEYADHRTVDTGAPFVDAVMRFGMGMHLTEEEEAEVAHIVRPCHAALGLASDFFSFDEEYAEFQKSGETTLANAVWLFTKWFNIDIAAAKAAVKEETKMFEKKFQRLRKAFVQQHPEKAKLRDYLKGLAYQMSGNVGWSSTCPRFHPENRYDPNIGTDVPEHPSCTERKHSLGEAPDLALASTEELSRRSFESDRSSLVSSNGSTCSRTSSVSSTSSFGSRFEDVAPTPPRKTSAPQLGDDHVSAPFESLTSPSSKGVRNTFIDALNIWLRLPETTVARVKSIINILNNASSMLEHIEEPSSPRPHTVFGQAQTINSANYHMLSALQEVMQLENPQCTKIFTEELQTLHIGQSWDLHWAQSGVYPTEEEYLEMADKKTGGLFRLAVRLLAASSIYHRALDIDRLVSLVAQYFQIRADYRDLENGVCGGLENGKYSFPLVHALNSEAGSGQLHGLFRQRMSEEGKDRVVEHLVRSGSFDYTRTTLHRLQAQINAEIARLEKRTRTMNWTLSLFVHKVTV